MSLRSWFRYILDGPVSFQHANEQSLCECLQLAKAEVTKAKARIAQLEQINQAYVETLELLREEKKQQRQEDQGQFEIWVNRYPRVFLNETSCDWGPVCCSIAEADRKARVGRIDCVHFKEVVL